MIARKLIFSFILHKLIMLQENYSIKFIFFLRTVYLDLYFLAYYIFFYKLALCIKKYLDKIFYWPIINKNQFKIIGKKFLLGEKIIMYRSSNEYKIGEKITLGLDNIMVGSPEKQSEILSFFVYWHGLLKSRGNSHPACLQALADSPLNGLVRTLEEKCFFRKALSSLLSDCLWVLNINVLMKWLSREHEKKYELFTVEVKIAVSKRRQLGVPNEGLPFEFINEIKPKEEYRVDKSTIIESCGPEVLDFLERFLAESKQGNKTALARSLTNPDNPLVRQFFPICFNFIFGDKSVTDRRERVIFQLFILCLAMTTTGSEIIDGEKLLSEQNQYEQMLARFRQDARNMYRNPHKEYYGFTEHLKQNQQDYPFRNFLIHHIQYHDVFYRIRNGKMQETELTLEEENFIISVTEIRNMFHSYTDSVLDLIRSLISSPLDTANFMRLMRIRETADVYLEEIAEEAEKDMFFRFFAWVALPDDVAQRLTGCNLWLASLSSPWLSTACRPYFLIRLFILCVRLFDKKIIRRFLDKIALDMKIYSFYLRDIYDEIQNMTYPEENRQFALKAFNVARLIALETALRLPTVDRSKIELLPELTESASTPAIPAQPPLSQPTPIVLAQPPLSKSKDQIYLDVNTLFRYPYLIFDKKKNEELAPDLRNLPKSILRPLTSILLALSRLQHFNAIRDCLSSISFDETRDMGVILGRPDVIYEKIVSKTVINIFQMLLLYVKIELNAERFLQCLSNDQLRKLFPYIAIFSPDLTLDSLSTQSDIFGSWVSRIKKIIKTEEATLVLQQIDWYKLTQTPVPLPEPAKPERILERLPEPAERIFEQPQTHDEVEPVSLPEFAEV